MRRQIYECLDWADSLGEACLKDISRGDTEEALMRIKWINSLLKTELGDL